MQVAANDSRIATMYRRAVATDCGNIPRFVGVASRCLDIEGLRSGELYAARLLLALCLADVDLKPDRSGQLIFAAVVAGPRQQESAFARYGGIHPSA